MSESAPVPPSSSIHHLPRLSQPSPEGLFRITPSGHAYFVPPINSQIGSSSRQDSSRLLSLPPLDNYHFPSHGTYQISPTATWVVSPEGHASIMRYGESQTTQGGPSQAFPPRGRSRMTAESEDSQVLPLGPSSHVLSRGASRMMIESEDSGYQPAIFLSDDEGDSSESSPHPAQQTGRRFVRETTADWNEESDVDMDELEEDPSYDEPKAPKKRKANKGKGTKEPAPAKKLKATKVAVAEEVIKSAARPANRPPPSFHASARELRAMGLEGMAKLDADKVDRAYDPTITDPNFKHQRHIARTDGRDNRPEKSLGRLYVATRQVNYDDEPSRWPEQRERVRTPTPLRPTGPPRSPQGHVPNPRKDRFGKAPTRRGRRERSTPRELFPQSPRPSDPLAGQRRRTNTRPFVSYEDTPPRLPSIPLRAVDSPPPHPPQSPQHLPAPVSNPPARKQPDWFSNDNEWMIMARDLTKRI